ERTGPHRRAVLRVADVERRVGQRHVLARRLHEREIEAGLPLHSPRGLELRRRRVDADDARAATREPGGEVRRPAAELDDVETVDVAENVQLGLGYPPDTPVDLLPRPGPFGLRVGVLAVNAGPVRDVLADVIRRAHRP